MPLPTIKPMIVAIGLTIMFAGLLPFGASVARAAAGAEGAGSLRVIGVSAILIGAALLVVSLYSWLLSPLEEPHEAHTV